MKKLGMIGKDGFTFFYGIEDIRLIAFMKAEEFFDDIDDLNYMYAEGFKPDTNLIVIYFNDGKVYTFNSAKYKIYFE